MSAHPGLPPDPAVRTRAVVQACLALGFARAGVARALPSSHPDAFRAWLSVGKHGQMSYLADEIETRLDVRRLLNGARSVVMVADQYASRVRGESGPSRGDDRPARAVGRIAKYARGRDYHAVMKDRLHRLADRMRAEFGPIECRSFVDTAPVLEREHAARAGLGAGATGAFIGKHTLLIDPRLGSYLVLGGIATTLELKPTAPGDVVRTDQCGSCTRCIDACPTGAITPYSVQATRCISYLTLEHEGPIAPDLQGRMGTWIVGCDVCQDVCPFNQPHDPGPDEPARTHPAYAESAALNSARLLDVIGWLEADRRRAMSVSAAKRADLVMIRRNALIALSNIPGAADDAMVRALVARLGADANEDPTIRTTAAQVLQRWGG